MPKELIDLLKLYARRGLEDWDKAPGLTKAQVSGTLANKVATKEWEASDTIEAVREEPNIHRCRFIPMPNVNHGGIKQCLFLPIKANDDRIAFDLLLFIDGGRWLGFRFEPADSPASTHGYGHVQMNTSMFRKQVAVNGIPAWLPVSYPAFPIRTSDPLQMFLSMATSVHGYENGIVRVIQDVFQNRPSDRARYLAALNFLTA
jgi:hypothetical protein